MTKLLSEGHNPTVSVGKTAYAVSSNKLVRDAFRRYMASEPQKWDWVLAGVPSALTPEMEAEQQAKQVIIRIYQTILFSNLSILAFASANFPGSYQFLMIL